MQLHIGIVGAGPAGSACAIELVKRGHSVSIFEKSSPPRPKACGDALIPDALMCLERLGVFEELEPHFFKIPLLRLVSPSGIAVDIPGRIYTCERFHFDNLLLKKALQLGGQLFVKEVVSVRQGNNDIHIQCSDGYVYQFDFVVGATGAGSKALDIYGTAYSKRPSAYAMRQYVELSNPHNIDAITFFYEKDVLPGYAWVFPISPYSVNIGIGITANAKGRFASNLRELYDQFITRNDFCAAIFKTKIRQDVLQGAPLRTGLKGSQFSNGRVLLCGEAVGTSYGMTGEGIGKAMETGIIAADTLNAFSEKHIGESVENVGANYREVVELRMRRKFKSYDRAQRWMSYPSVIDFFIRNAKKRGKAHKLLTQILAESCDPTELLSVRGLTSLAFTSPIRQ